MKWPYMIVLIGMVGGQAAAAEARSSEPEALPSEGDAEDHDEGDAVDETRTPTEADSGDRSHAEGSANGEAAASPEPAASAVTEEAPSPETVPTPEERLAQAVRSYQLGKRLEARDLLVALVSDAGIEDPDTRQRARVYLGELLYVSGDQEGARRFFELVLEEDSTFVIDPFRHPPGVCGYFNYVRSYKVPLVGGGVPDELLLTPPPAPASSWAPFGVYHLSEGAPLRGSLYAAGSTALGAASLLLFYRLSGDRSWDEGDEIELARLRRLKGTQYGLSAGFYTLWGLSVVDAHTHWRRIGHTRKLSAPAPSLELSGRF